MAFRTWVKLLGTVVGVAALAGASQLGLAYGLGIVRLTRVLDDAARDQWTAQLAWVAWFAMTSAVLGGLAGGRLRDSLRGPVTAGTHIAVAVAAGAGAAIVVPLTMQPARTAQIAGVDPVFVIGLCAAFGALVGAFAAYAVLAHVVARWSVSVVGIAIWVIAIVSVLPSLGPSAPLPAVRLGVFDAGFLSPALTQRTALFTMPALALLVGATHGWTARRREMPTLTIALAGLPGPALLTVAYLIAGPGSGADRYQIVPYWAAMTATGAGVLGSVLAAVIGRSDAAAEPADDRDTGPASPPADDTTPVLPAAPAEGRRSSAVDAFRGRSAEWPARRTETADGGGVAGGEYAGPEPAPFDAFAAASRTPEQSTSGAGTFAPNSLTPDGPEAGRPGANTLWPGGPGTSTLWPGGRESSGLGPATLGPGTSGPDRLGSDSLGSDSLGRDGLGRDGLGPDRLRPDRLGPDSLGRDGLGPDRPGPDSLRSAALQPVAPDHRTPEPSTSGPTTTRAGAPEASFSESSAFGSHTLDPQPFGAAEPYMPEPATGPHSPAPVEEPPAGNGGLLARMSFGRGRGRAAKGTPAAPPLQRSAAEPPSPDQTPDPSTWPGRRPLVPEPHAVSAPLPQPEPVSPPLSVTPAPDRRDRKRRGDDEFVDWVSGLGSPSDDGR